MVYKLKGTISLQNNDGIDISKDFDSEDDAKKSRDELLGRMIKAMEDDTVATFSIDGHRYAVRGNCITNVELWVKQVKEEALREKLLNKEVTTKATSPSIARDLPSMFN